MHRDEHLFDKIETYLRGQMLPAEAAAFEAEMAADPELAAQVKLHRLERQGQEWLVERDLLAKMNVWEREAEKPVSVAPMRVSFVRRWWAVGVAATLILAVFGWWLLQPQADIGGAPPIVTTTPKPKPPATTPPKTTPKPSQKPPTSQPKDKDDDRVAETTKPAPVIPTPKPEAKPPAAATKPAVVDYPALAAAYYREEDFIKKSDGGAGDAPGYGQALDSYKSGKYADAEKLLKPILKLNPNALKTKELLAHSLYKKKQYDAAIPYFRELANSKDKAIAERSEWALALTALQKMPAQKVLLNRTLDKILARPGHAFYQKAAQLKNALKQAEK